MNENQKKLEKIYSEIAQYREVTVDVYYPNEPRVSEYEPCMIGDVIHYAKEYFHKKYPRQDQKELRDFIRVLRIGRVDTRSPIDYHKNAQIVDHVYNLVKETDDRI